MVMKTDIDKIHKLQKLYACTQIITILHTILYSGFNVQINYFHVLNIVKVSNLQVRERAKFKRGWNGRSVTKRN